MQPNRTLAAVGIVLSGITTNSQKQPIGQLEAAARLFKSLPAWTIKSDCQQALNTFNEWARKLGVYDRKFCVETRKFVNSLPTQRPKDEIPVDTFMALAQTDAIQAAFDQALNRIPGLVGHEAVERMQFACDFAATIVPQVDLDISTAMYNKLVETAKTARVNASPAVQKALDQVGSVLKKRTNGHGDTTVRETGTGTQAAAD